MSPSRARVHAWEILRKAERSPSLTEEEEASLLLLRSAALIVGVPYGLSRTLNGV